MFRQIGLVAAVSLSLASAAFAQSGDGAGISVEFNDLQQAEDGCRAVFVLKNGFDTAIDELTMRLVAFDGEGRASLFLSLDVGALPVNKTRVLRFDLGPDSTCDAIGKLLLDDVLSCSGGDLDPATCLSSVSLSSRAGIPLDY